MQILDEKGKVDKKLLPKLKKDELKEMYRLMLLLRTMDEKLFALQRSGKIGTYAQTKGQEACQIASGLALTKDDWMVPSFREMGVFLARGADKATIVQGWKGDVRAFQTTEMNCLPPAIPIASQCVQAVGIAWAQKLKKEKNATIVYFGDGATSEGDFHEAMNFAGVLNLPVVFFNQNNQWAISTRRKQQTASETIVQKAGAYGMAGIQVDGNDILAVHKATTEALERARAGKGPTLIEAITFRMGDHTTSDSSEKYREPKECEEWAKKDPIKRFEAYLKSEKILTDSWKKGIEKDIQKEIEDAVAKGTTVPAPSLEELFKPIYTEMTPELQEQLEALKLEQDSSSNGGEQ